MLKSYTLKNNGPTFEKLSFVVLAICKDKAQNEGMHHVYADDDYIVCTDGARLHAVNNEGLLEPGFYRLIKSTKTALDIVKVDDDNLLFPQYKRIIPDNPSFLSFKYSSVEGCYTQIIKSVDEDYALNYKFFSDACQNVEEFYLKDSFSPLLMTGEDRISIVMPLLLLRWNDK